MKIKKVVPLIVFLILTILLTGLVYFFSAYESSAPEDSSAATSRSNNNYVIATGNKLTLKNQPYEIRSTQFINIQTDVTGQPLTTFSAATFSAPNVTKAFEQMNKMGYNSVRLVYHTQADSEIKEGGAFCKENTTYVVTDCINEQSIINLAETINIANQYNLKVIISFVGGTPFRYYTTSSVPYNNENINFLKEETVRDYGRFLKDFLAMLDSKIISKSTVMAVQPFAEPSIQASTNSYPFNQNARALKSPEFYLPEGKSYIVNSSLLNKSNGQSSAQMKEILNYTMVNSFNHWRSKVKEANNNYLVIYEQFPAYAVQSDALNRHVDDSVLVNPFNQADIIGMQLYTDYLLSGHNLDNIMNFTPGFAANLDKKPFLVMEYGMHRNIRSSNDGAYLRQWLWATCKYNPVGWNYFYWASDDKKAANFVFKSGNERNFYLANQLSPKLLVSPCPAVSASKTLTGSSAANVLDKNRNTIWNAGDSAPQSIVIDLKGNQKIAKIKLTTSQYPAGRTTHKVYLSKNPIGLSGSLSPVLIKTLTGTTKDNQTLEISLSPNFAQQEWRYIKVETTQSPSFVAWRDIEIE